MSIANIPSQPKAVYVDVDGTLIDRGRLNARLVEQLVIQRSTGWFIALWSSRGLAYAQAAAKDHNITDLFDVILPKPGIMIDDQGAGWLKYVRLIMR